MSKSWGEKADVLGLGKPSQIGKGQKPIYCFHLHFSLLFLKFIGLNFWFCIPLLCGYPSQRKQAPFYEDHFTHLSWVQPPNTHYCCLGFFLSLGGVLLFPHSDLKWLSTIYEMKSMLLPRAKKKKSISYCLFTYSQNTPSHIV